MKETLLVKAARIIDPVTGYDAISDFYVANGLVAKQPKQLPKNTKFIQGEGLVLVPGLIDLHVHLREPGDEMAETIASGCQAAARGGFTTIVAMPNTRPPIDNYAAINWQKKRAEAQSLVRLLPTGCLTIGRAGLEMTDLESMAHSGAIAFTDDGTTPSDAILFEKILARAAQLGLVVLDHAEDSTLGAGGVMHEGEWSAKHNLPGIPSAREVNIIKRDIMLSEKTGCAVHIQHLSTAEGVQLVREARRRGLKISAEVTPHHLALTDADVDPNNASYKMNPPLRSAADRHALQQGVVDGTIEAFATDHAPHTADAKARGFINAPFGIVGLETAVGITYTTMVVSGLMSLHEWLKRWTIGPAKILGLPQQSIGIGQPAVFTILDLESEWEVDPQTFLSRSRNTPFAGRRLIGKAVYTAR